MKQMFRLLFVGLLGGLWQSLEVVQCQNLPKNWNNIMSDCYNTSSGKTCFTTLLANRSHPVLKTFKAASQWCNATVPGSSLIIFNRQESQRNVDSFIGRRILANETIIIDAQKLSASERLEWSWVNGHPTIPTDVRYEDEQIRDGACVELKDRKSLAYCFANVSSLFRFICEFSESKRFVNYRQNNKSYVASQRVATWYDARNECLRLGGDLASITDFREIMDRTWLTENQRYWIGLHRNKWIWNSTGDQYCHTLELADTR